MLQQHFFSDTYGVLQFYNIYIDQHMADVSCVNVGMKKTARTALVSTDLHLGADSPSHERRLFH